VEKTVPVARREGGERLAHGPVPSDEQRRVRRRLHPLAAEALDQGPPPPVATPAAGDRAPRRRQEPRARLLPEPHDHLAPFPVVHRHPSWLRTARDIRAYGRMTR
jgi:hypothetical protein